MDDTPGVRDRDDPRVTLLGHSTILIEMDGVRVLTDPLLRARVGPLTRTSSPPRPEHWADPDVVLISHTHWDHLDYGSLRMLGMGVHIVVPSGQGLEVRRRGFANVTEASAGDRVGIDGLTIEAVHAEHRGFGPPIAGTERSLGFVIHGSQRHYFAGDTSFFAAMADLDIGLDVALLPVWGWGPTAKPGHHLDPMGAARAAAVIRPRIAIPIHWGTLHPVGLRWIRPSTRIDPPHQFAQLVRRLSPDTVVRVLPDGATLSVPPGRRTIPPIPG